MTAPAYTVRPLEEADEPAVLELLTLSLAGGPTGERTTEFLRWKHRDNPAGSSPGLVAVTEEGQLAAVRLLLRWDLLLDGQPVRAVRAVDTATHPDHQGRGLFRRLTLEALDTVVRDADLVFNTPNDQSRPGYLKMGWQEVAELPVLLRPLRPLTFLRGVRSSGQAPVSAAQEALSSPLVRAADLLQARGSEVESLVGSLPAPRGRLHTARSLDYLHWRFGSAPGLDYRAVVVDDGSGLRALGLGRLRRRGALVEFTLGEVFARENDDAGRRLVLRGARRSGADHVALLTGHDRALLRAARRTAFLPVPGRGLTLVANPRKPLPVDPSRPSSWALTLGDLEVF